MVADGDTESSISGPSGAGYAEVHATQDMNANTGVTHLMAKAIVEKCTNQSLASILTSSDIGRQVSWEGGDDHCGEERANPACVPC